MNITPMPNKILATNVKRGERKIGRFVIMDDDKKTQGIRARWFQVWKIGSSINEDFKEGEWILVEHGRWSREVKIDEDTSIWSIDIDSILCVSSSEPNDDYLKGE